MDVHFFPSRHENWWMTFPQKNVQQNWKSKSCDFGRLPNSLFHAYLKIWKRNASPLAKKNTQKKDCQKCQKLTFLTILQWRGFSVSVGISRPRKWEKKILFWWWTSLETKGVNHPRLNLKSIRIQKSVKTHRTWAKKNPSSATTVCCFDFDDFDGVEILLDKSEHVRINKSQGANIHVFHPLHLGTSALGNKLSWDQRQISWGVTEPARFFSYYATCRCSWPGSGVKKPAAVSKLAFWCVSMYKYV